MIQPRPYQTEILTAIDKALVEFSKVLTVAPTGSGKTCIFSWLAKRFADSGKRSLVLVDQTELVWQTVEKMKNVANLPCEVEKAEWRANINSQVVVATVQTMARRLAEWPKDHFGLVVADEADKSISPQWMSVLNHFDGNAKVCGFTATPWRSDKRSLGEYYESIAAEIGLFDLIQQGYLAPISVKMLPISIDLNRVHTKNGDFDTTDLHDAITPHLLEAARAIRAHASFRRVLVFVPLIATSQKFVEICRSIGLSAEHIDGTSEDRAEKLKRFADWDFDVLVNSALLLRGVDIPPIDCVVMLRPTKSISLYQQAIGRGTRLADGKEDLLLLDFLYQAEKKLVCRPAHLIAKTEEEADTITELSIQQFAGMPEDVATQIPLDLQGLASEAAVRREAMLRRKLEEHKDKKGKFISAEEFAVRFHALEVAEFEPTMKWEGEPITDKQAKYLKQAGIDLETVKGKGHASKLLNLYFANKPLQLASDAQRYRMRQMGHPNWENATSDDARKFFAGLRRKEAFA